MNRSLPKKEQKRTEVLVAEPKADNLADLANEINQTYDAAEFWGEHAEASRKKANFRARDFKVFLPRCKRT